MPRPASLTPELLQTFITLAQTNGDAMQAARLLNINQPSMSKRLALLQHAGRVLRHPWIERHGKSWLLTDEGKRVFPAVEAILHRYRVLTDSIYESNRPAWVFACDPNLMEGFIREAVSVFIAQYSDCRFQLTTPRTQIRIEGVANGSFDLAVVSESDAEIFAIARRPLKIETLFADHLLLVAKKSSSFAQILQPKVNHGLTAQDLLAVPFLLTDRDSSLRKRLDDRFRTAGIFDSFRVVLETGKWATLLAYVRENLGVAIIPQSGLWGCDTRDLWIRPLPESISPTNECKLISRLRPVSEEPDLPPVGMALRDILKQLAKEFQDKTPSVD